MASISLRCPKCSITGPGGLSSRNRKSKPLSLSVIPQVLGGSGRISRSQGLNRIHLPILRAQAAVGGSSISSTSLSANLESPSSDGKDPKSVEGSDQGSALSESYITTFMAEVLDLVKLVDSRDIMELELKKGDYELIIRKRGTLAQVSPTAPVVMMQPSQQYMHPSQSPTPQPIHAVTPSPPSPAIPAISKGSSKSSLPPLKCPMAGTFYRCSAPGEPPFVKVGDKVKKGQVVCIIEAMKLMNEIEADRSGTVVDILAKDGKPVSVDMPLLVIQP